jgi:orotate phosphoribosyltransferase-like protein
MIDEMKPSLRTIMNRIKEVFGYKVEPFITNMLIESIKGNEVQKVPLRLIGKTIKK